jgi:hypothetical protein
MASFESAWQTRGPEAWADCAKFVESRARSSDGPADDVLAATINVGLWVLWNVYGTKPPSSDKALVTVLGPNLLATVVRCWGAPE